MSSGKKVALSSGHQIPQLGYGTWQSSPGEVSIGIFEALRAGYRHLDLAPIYRNQHEVAIGLKKAFKEIPGLKREDIFITSKLWNNQHRPDDVQAALDACLAELELDYLDLYLVHWPVSFKKGDELFPLAASGSEVELDDGVTIVETWKAMTQLPKRQARSVGVSNHTVEYLEKIIAATGVVPAVNQVERHPLLQDPKLVEYCKSKKIHITAYSAFGNNNLGFPLLVTQPEVKEVAEKLSATPAQVLLAWAQVGGHSVIPKSVTPSRIVENFKETDLSAEDVAAISAIGKQQRRYNVPFTYTPRWNINLFDDEKERTATHKVIQ